MKVLVADKFEDSGRRGLAEIGCEVAYEPDLSSETLADAVRQSEAEVLVVRSTEVKRAALETGRLGLVVRAGAGYNTIDVEAASERGIWVANCPGKNAVAVAELAFALMLALDRRVADNTTDLRNGKWNKKEYGKARGLYGRTLGVLGTGTIGREVIARARAFGMPVVAWSRSLTAAAARELGVVAVGSPTEVAAASDVVSVHLALKPETRGLVSDGVFASMRPGTIFINTARAEITDQHALERAVNERGIRAGLDVFAEEPSGGTGNVDAPIFRLPNVIGTHHIGASTDQAQEAIADETVRVVRLYKETGRPANVVNLAKKSPATHLLAVRHYDRVGVLAAVFDCLKKGGINVQETENIVFEGARAAIARIHVDRAPSGEVLSSLRTCTDDILDVSLVAL
ncbi:D-3-phosphoglycerate dehydrogenase [Labilithrix luteola]|uniref:D-3-phosphoglycerate dehydrogenase n=1 Tax=Labilithrix luteola TaxID=1391654 RepID=A0A0K1Q963_9BACT|nr:3-phosphoglycerate dehydrogenase [Labilithrix luteola]AKV01965.1 D-3-phosphoglycerate dehydrogenase [Labilithrix luteola]